MSERFSKLEPNSERWRQRSKKNYEGSHFRCYSVFKMCQIMPKCPRHYQKGPSYYQMSPRDYQMSATYYQKCPRERTQLWLRRLPVLAPHFAFVRPFQYPATFCFSTTPQHCLTLRTLFQHFAAHLGFARPFQYLAIFCFSSTPQHCSCPTLRTLSFLLLYNSATLLMFNFTLWLCAAFVVRNKFWSQRRSKLTPVCAFYPLALNSKWGTKDKV